MKLCGLLVILIDVEFGFCDETESVFDRTPIRLGIVLPVEFVAFIAKQASCDMGDAMSLVESFLHRGHALLERFEFLVEDLFFFCGLLHGLCEALLGF